jgi:catechol 2,3-dioxygenase-like lactoylglutathione lyase family enzyme
MNPSPSVLRISPMLATANMDETLAFYHEVLGFSPIRQSPNYSIVQRDGFTIHFQRAADETVLRSMREHTEFYIEVRGIHALWEHVKTFKDRYKIRDLFDRDYGMTEFHIVDPSGVLVFVGEVTAQIAGCDDLPLSQ